MCLIVNVLLYVSPDNALTQLLCLVEKMLYVYRTRTAHSSCTDHAAHSYDEAQLLSSALELSQLLPTTSSDREALQLMAQDIISYVAKDLTSPQGGFYSAEDADSLPTHESTVKKEGAFYVWTAHQLDELLGPDAELFKYHYGVKDEGNCDPSHDIQGELKGQVRSRRQLLRMTWVDSRGFQNVLYTAHTPEESAHKFGKSVEDAQKTLAANLATLREYRDKHRPRPHLDDKILTCWNGLMVRGSDRTFLLRFNSTRVTDLRAFACLRGLELQHRDR